MTNRRPSNLDLKIVVLGPAGVGKTCLIHRFCNGEFLVSSMPTVGAGFFPHTMQIEDTEVSIMLWDTAGDERFKSVIPSLLRGAQGLVLVYDVTSLQTFADLNRYLDLFLDTAEYDPNAEYLPILLLGNKCDMEERDVPQEEINNWLRKNRVKYFKLVSAKTGEGIQDAFKDYLQMFVGWHEKSDIVAIPIDQTNEKKSCC